MVGLPVLLEGLCTKKNFVTLTLALSRQGRGIHFLMQQLKTRSSCMADNLGRSTDCNLELLPLEGGEKKRGWWFFFLSFSLVSKVTSILKQNQTKLSVNFGIGIIHLLVEQKNSNR